MSPTPAPVAPTASPVVAAPIAPSPAPVAPTTLDNDPVCDDTNDEFTFRGRIRHCDWLRFRPGQISRACGEPAVYEACPETCGHCEDECEDETNVVFKIDNRIGDKNCRWIGNNRARKDKYCTPDHVAFFVCKETCENCEGEYETFPSSAPSAPYVDDDVCQDDSTETFLYGENERNCQWLSQGSRVRRDRLCIPEEKAYWVCEETCDRCTPDGACEDIPSFTFSFGRRPRATCRWLSRQNAFQKYLACSDDDVRDGCPLTCDSCATRR